jgi:hypothetical protein
LLIPGQKKKSNQGLSRGDFEEQKKYRCAEALFALLHSGIINLRMDFRIRCKHLHLRLKKEIAGKKPHRKPCRILHGRMANNKY